MDVFSANGCQGQRVFIIPFKDMVIVRFGLGDKSEFDCNALLSGIVNEIA